MSEPNPGSSFAANAYASALVPGKPRDSLNVIQQRLKKAKIFNDELADYFTARRELEEAYLKQLQRIAKKDFLSDPSVIPPGYVPVYERLIQELGEVANVHGELEKRIGDECEAVTRNASTLGEWSRLREHDDSLGNTIKEINSLESQLVKDQKKVEGASTKKASQAQAKVQETERAITQTIDIWETEAPFAFEVYQRVDAQRLELLKEVVAKFATAQSDAAQKRMQMSERTMQECLNFDTQADMQEFILKNGVASTGARNGRSVGAPSVRRGSNNASFTRSNGMGEFGVSNASIHSADRTVGTIEETTPSKSGGSTLRSAFSRIGRRKDKDTSSNTNTIYGPLPEEPARTPSDSGKARQAYAPPSTSRPSQLGVVGEDSIDSNAGSDGLMAPMSPSSIGGSRDTAYQSSAPPKIQINTGSAPQVDAEGYSIPPPDRKPWEIPAAGTLSLMDDPDESQGTIGDLSVSSRMTNMNISSKPIAERTEQDKAALERMRSTLGAPQRRATTSRRDRRDVRNTTYMPGIGVGGDDPRMSQFGTMTTSPGTSTPTSPFGTGQSTFAGQPALGSHRTQSMSSMASANPFENSTTSAGVRASLTERVNVIFAGREISKVMVVGELSISLRDITPTSKPLHLRLESFEQLEKAAPNPAFLKPVADRPGEYHLNLQSLLAQGGLPGNSGQAVVLKYQVHVSDSRKAQFVPLVVHSQWRCEPHQTSFLCTYNSTLPSDTMIQDLQFAVQVSSSNVTNVMTKPTGTWSSETKNMFWKLNEGVSTQAKKLLARFQIEGAVTAPQPVFIKWKVAGRTMSNLSIQVIDAEEPFKIGEIVRQTVAGKYISGP